MSRRRVLPRLALIAAGCALALTLGEVLVRVQVHGREKQTLEDWQAMAAGRATAAGGQARLGELIRTSEHSRVLYELIPGISGVTYLGQPMRTNRLGFRGPEVAEEPPAGTFRILGLGDSVMFGWGVREEESYLRVLERELDASSERAFEVINTAVPGYNTAMEVATLETKGLELSPDLVILGFVGNDRSLPNLIPAEPGDYWTLTRSYLWEAVRPLLGLQRSHPLDLVDAPRAGENEAHFEYDPERVPERFRDMVGAEGVRRALHRLQRLGEEHGFGVLVFAHFVTPDYVDDVCRELGLPLLSHRAAIETYMRDRGITLDAYAGSELTLSDTDAHPSALHHGILGRALAAHLRDRGMLR